jgi:tape measure domain-containing protein
LNIDKTTEAYSRFVISSRASGVSLEDSNKIFRAISTALQVVGANSEQTELAFYGLTQMMQKGKVVSEEFNRQIGEQLPGNAVFGAQALSKLTGRFVSVGEFFKQMSKGIILSAQFVPVYADIIGKAFEPLMKVAEMRPDFALNQLKDSFLVFAREVGRATFMSALTKEFRAINAQIVTLDANGVAHLTPAAQKLATELGQKLASAAHALSLAIQFLAKHITEVITGFKIFLGLLAVNLVVSFTKNVGSSALAVGGFAKEIRALTGALLGLKAVEESLVLTKMTKFFDGTSAAAREAKAAVEAETAARTASGAGYMVAPVGKFSSATASRAASTFGGEAEGILTGGAVGAFGAHAVENAVAKRAENFAASNLTRGGVAGLEGAAMGTALNFTKAEGPMLNFGRSAATASSGIGAVVAAVLGLGPVMGTLVLTLGAVAAALAVVSGWMVVFHDHTVKVNQKVATMGDVVMASFGDMGDQIGDFVKNAGGALAALFGLTGPGLEKAFKGIDDVMTKIFIGAIASIEALVGVVVHAVEALGKLSEAARLASHGGTKEAKRLAGEALDLFKGDNPMDIADRIASKAATRASERDNRNALAAAGDPNEEIMKNAAEQIHALQEAGDVMRKAGEMQEAQTAATLNALSPPSWDDLRKQLAAADKVTSDAAKTSADAAKIAANAAQLSAENSPIHMAAPVAGQTQANAYAGKAPQELIDAAKAYAPHFGLDPQVLINIAGYETGGTYNPKAKNPKSSATGLYQFTDDTARDFALIQNGIDYRTDITRSTVAEATRLAKLGAQLKTVTGHNATAGEEAAIQVLGLGQTLEQFIASPKNRGKMPQTTGTIKFMTALAQNPEMLSSLVFPDLVSTNKDIFMENGKPRTLSQLMGKFNAIGGGTSAPTAGIGGPVLPGMSPDDLLKKQQQAETMRSQLDSILAAINPGFAAMAQEDKLKISIAEFIQKRNDYETKYGKVPLLDKIKTQGDLDQAIGALNEREHKKVADALDPISKEVRLQKEANDIIEMRLNNKSTEADYQEKINALVQQGYTKEQVATQLGLKAFEIEQDRKDVLEQRLKLTEELNKLELGRMARNPETLFQSAVASRLKIEPGQTVQQAIEDAKQKGTFNLAAQGARADFSDKFEQGIQTQTEALRELAATAHLNASAKAQRDDYKGFLKELTGSQHEALTAIEADADALTKETGQNYREIAASEAKLKFELENPPGFRKWADALEPFSRRLQDIKGDFVESLSEGITDALSGDKVDWTGKLKDISKKILKAQVDDILGGFIKSVTGGAMGGGAKLNARDQAIVDAYQNSATHLDVVSDKMVDANVDAATKLGTAGDRLIEAAQALGQAASGGGGSGSGFNLGGGGGGSGFSLGGGGSGFSLGNFGGSGFDLGGGSGGFPDFSLGGFSGGGFDLGASGFGSAGMSAAEPDLGTVLPDFVGFGSNTLGSMSSMAGATPFDAMTVENPQAASLFMPEGPLEGMPDVSGMGSGGAGGILGSIMGGAKGFMGSSNPLAQLGKLGLVGMIANLLSPHKKKSVPPPSAVNGIIGQSGQINTTGTAIAGHTNPIGQILSLVASMALSAGFGNMFGPTAGAAGGSNMFSQFGHGVAGGFGFGNAGASASGVRGAGSSFFTDIFKNMFSSGGGDALAGLYMEGGYAGSPMASAMASGYSWRDVPHYAEGTANTNGIPSILHPDEAVIPLSRGRMVPVELRGGDRQQQQIIVNAPVNVYTPNADSFRHSDSAIQRAQTRTLTRTARRNLTAA